MSDQALPPVPFNDLGRNTERIRADIDAAIARVVSSGWYVLGPEHDAFEAELAAYVGSAHGIGVGNGTDALQLALTALGVVAGDTVLTAANAGGYTSTAVRSIGATPVFADVDSTSMLLTAQTVETALEALPTAPKVLVVTHLFGAAADIRSIVDVAQRHGIRVVEDCAQSLGAVVDGARAGSFADVATTSFYPTKNLGALGDGGALLTSDDEIATSLRRLRQYGWESKYRTSLAGGRNSRLDELQAAVLRAKLPHLDGWNDERRAIHQTYERAIGSGARLVNVAGDGFVAHLAVIEVDNRDAVRALFDARGIRTDVHYPIPDHRQPLAAGAAEVYLPATEVAADRILSIPMFPELTALEVGRISAVLAEL